MSSSRTLLLVPALVAGALLASAPLAAAATTVDVGDNWFVSSSGVPKVTVSKGTAVKWVFKGKSPHNVKVAKGPATFGSPTRRSGSYTKTVKKKGTYTLVCTVHGPKDQSMKLVVK